MDETQTLTQLDYQLRIESVQAELDSIRQCSLSVINCNEQKRVVHEINYYQPSTYGNRKYAWQCLKCLRKSAAFTPTRDQKQAAVAFNLAEQKALAQKRKDLYDLQSRLSKQKFEAEKSDWLDYYNEVLQSPEWQAKRLLVFARAGGICEGCGTNPATQVHHLTYEMLGHEMLFQLVAVCDPCHSAIHQFRKPQ